LRISPVVSIVDDDRAVRDALSSLIRSLGWQACKYESAEDFLSSGQAAHTSCLISDIRMPGMSGIEMHECLRAQGHAPATIFISAYPTPALQAKARVAAEALQVGCHCSLALGRSRKPLANHRCYAEVLTHDGTQ
jgi:FixJ family two-component response regulator